MTTLYFRIYTEHRCHKTFHFCSFTGNAWLITLTSSISILILIGGSYFLVYDDIISV